MQGDHRSPLEKERDARITVLNLVPRDGTWASLGDLACKAKDQHLSKPTLTKHLKQLVEFEELLTKKERGQKPAGRRGPAPWRFYRRNIKEPRTLNLHRMEKILKKRRAYWTYTRQKICLELEICYLRFFLDTIETLGDARERSRTPERLELMIGELADVRLRPKLGEMARLLWPVREDKDEEIIYGLWDSFMDQLDQASQEWRRRYCPKWARKYRQELSVWPTDLALTVILAKSRQQARRHLEERLDELHDLREGVERLRPRVEAILAKTSG